MNIVVCVKQVPDTETQIKITSDGRRIVTDGVKFIVNPYDEYAIEEAVRSKERLKAGSVVAITLGPDRAKEALRTALAMGADRALHLVDKAFAGPDSFSTAYILAEAIKTLSCDLIFLGKQAIDVDRGQVGPSLAEFLGLPFVNNIIKVEIADDRKSAKVTREVEGAVEIIEVAFPAVLAAKKGLNDPRYPSLMNIMQAKKKEIKEVKAADLGLPADVGVAQGKLKLIKLEYPPARAAGKLLEGDACECVQQLVRLLREEAKIL
jgi:electron transfer flavoprotein beta subunit